MSHIRITGEKATIYSIYGELERDIARPKISRVFSAYKKKQIQKQQKLELHSSINLNVATEVDKVRTTETAMVRFRGNLVILGGRSSKKEPFTARSSVEEYDVKNDSLGLN